MTPQIITPPKHTTACRFCRQQFRAASMGMPKIGETAPPRVIQFVTALAGHLNDSHRDEMTRMSGSIQDFTGLLIINAFETDDPGLLARINMIRADIHKRTRKHFVTDAAILDLVSRVGLDPEQEQTVGALLRGMRDAYEEVGNYAADKTLESLIIQP